ncbi:MAG: hypothetical protein NWF05_02780 [Candidatus Bathyarchaeota archaeon]|nr:hypothetical protein [Candidatus Bathyarchaeota archaeon]
MKTKKVKICTVMLSIIVISFLSTYPTFATDSSATDATAEEKLPAFLNDVLAMDLTKYTIVAKGCGVQYPTEFGGSVKQETIGMMFNSTDSQISVTGVFLNGYIDGIILRVVRGSIIYIQQPSKSAVTETRNILERYVAYSEKYGIYNAHVTSALTMLNKVSDSPVTEKTQNLNSICNFVQYEEISGDMRVATSDSSIGFGYVFKEIHLPNRGLGIGFGNNHFTFADTWGLYTVACGSAITEEEATVMALKTAKNYNITLINENSSTFILHPDWSNTTVEISLNMIPGEIFNTQLNNDIGAVNSGNKNRNPLGLYPFWAATVYFSKPINNIAGVQVGIWGDTKEIAYVTTYGHLGSQDNSDNPDQNQVSSNEIPEFPDGIFALVSAVLSIAVLTAAWEITKRRRK